MAEISESLSPIWYVSVSNPTLPLWIISSNLIALYHLVCTEDM